MRGLQYDSSNRLITGLAYKKKQKDFRITKSVRAGLIELIDAAKAEMGIVQDSSEIAERFWDRDFISAYFAVQDWIKACQTRKSGSPIPGRPTATTQKAA